MSKAIILDSETTGLPPKGEACEIAFFEISTVLPTMSNFEEKTYGTNFFYRTEAANLIADTIKLTGMFHQTFMPKGEFNPRASVVNGFTKENLKGSPCISTFDFPTAVEFMIGHNILFDWQMVTKPDVKLVCTKELAIKYLTKQSGAGTKGVNTLTGLIERYYPKEAKELIANAHSALQDCKLCYLILLKILEVAPELDSFEKLAAQCTQPNGKKNGTSLPRGIELCPYTKQHLIKFGTKFPGISLEVVNVTDRGYLQWIVDKSYMSADLKEFIGQFLKAN